MNTDFTFVYTSGDLNSDFVTLWVCYKDQLFYELDREKGIDKVEINLFHDAYILETKVELKCSFASFMENLDKAEKYLIEG